MRSLAIDVETFSPVPLAKTGVYPYAAHPEFELLLFGYSIDGGDVHVVDLASGDQLPDKVLRALVDPGVIKWAHKAAFERVALSAWLHRHHPDLLNEEYLDPAQWRCTMIWSAYLGLPMSFDAAATALQAFRDGKDLYCETASRMFGVPVDKHGINAELRQKGKIATLACGYNGSVGALKAMGALRMGLAEQELKPIVDAWRAANPNIVQLWADVEQATIDAITTRQPIQLRNLAFSVESDILFIELPSGRRLAYVQPRLGENRWGGTSITYSGVTTGRKWGRLETYGGKLVENIVQAIARDLLVHAMGLVAGAGHQIVMHVHDEIVIDQARLLADYDKLLTQISDLENRQVAYRHYRKELDKLDIDHIEFTPYLWHILVDHAEVSVDTTIIFTFRDGSSRQQMIGK